MTQELILTAMYRQGREDAFELQAMSTVMDGTALCQEADIIPEFKAAKTVMNMLERAKGFVCKSSAGRVVQLIQPYDSDTFPQEPEELSAQWGFKWSHEPGHALPFVAISTSPYMKGDCCLNEAGEVRRSCIDNNVWSPDVASEYWEEA